MILLSFEELKRRKLFACIERYFHIYGHRLVSMYMCVVTMEHIVRYAYTYTYIMLHIALHACATLQYCYKCFNGVTGKQKIQEAIVDGYLAFDHEIYTSEWHVTVMYVALQWSTAV